jgi:RHS repeat-associated protein
LSSSPTRTVLSTTAYAPFGETYAQSGTADLSFTGQNSDTVPGDYDFLYREYSTQGRWSSPDPAGLSSVSPAFPQSWNRYAYVTNSPLSAVDPLGLNCVWDDGSYDAQDDPGTHTQMLCEQLGGTWFAGNMGGDWSPNPNDFWAEQAAIYNGTGNAIPVISMAVWSPYDTSLQGSTSWAFAAPWYFQPKGPGHGGPYRPYVGPQEPDNPIWPRPQPPTTIVPDDPENWVPPDPIKLTLWDKIKFGIVKAFQAFGSDGSVEFVPLIMITPCQSGAMPQLGPGGMSCPKMY